MWLLDRDAYETYEVYFSESRKQTRKCLALAERILSINQELFSPFHLGLALQMHHMFGSGYLLRPCIVRAFVLLTWKLGFI